jgi:hypothetical protein
MKTKNTKRNQNILEFIRALPHKPLGRSGVGPVKDPIQKQVDRGCVENGKGECLEDDHCD